jgi:hypothetical protein
VMLPVTVSEPEMYGELSIILFYSKYFIKVLLIQLLHFHYYVLRLEPILTLQYNL